MKKNIVNIINFIRGVHPRHPERDLTEPVANQIRLAKEYDLKNTFLLQYDALINPIFQQLLLCEKNEKTEIGAWFEVVQPLAEKAGLKWRGRDGWAWDYHANVGFLIGYTPAEREILIDVYMEDYKNIIGRYPESVGSWFIDAHSFEYMYEKYGIKAACICRDQWGTDVLLSSRNPRILANKTP